MLVHRRKVEQEFAAQGRDVGGQALLLRSDTPRCRQVGSGASALASSGQPRKPTAHDLRATGAGPCGPMEVLCLFSLLVFGYALPKSRKTTTQYSSRIKRTTACMQTLLRRLE